MSKSFIKEVNNIFLDLNGKGCTPKRFIMMFNRYLLYNCSGTINGTDWKDAPEALIVLVNKINTSVLNSGITYGSKKYTSKLARMLYTHLKIKQF